MGLLLVFSAHHPSQPLCDTTARDVAFVHRIPQVVIFEMVISPLLQSNHRFMSIFVAMSGFLYPDSDLGCG